MVFFRAMSSICRVFSLRCSFGLLFVINFRVVFVCFSVLSVIVMGISSVVNVFVI